MISISVKAASQIRNSAQESGITDPILRIAVKKLENGHLHYAMGFDDKISEIDSRFESEGIQLVIAEISKPLAEGMTIDYVTLDSGEDQFIFINPQDRNYSPPADE